MLDPLFTYSLARPSDDGSSFSVHPLVHVWALQRQDEKQQRTNKAQAARLLNGIFSLFGDHTDLTPATQMVIATIFAHVFVFSTHLSLDGIGDEDPSIISSLHNIGDECMRYALFSQAFRLRSLVVRWYQINHEWEKYPIIPFSDNLLGLTCMSIGGNEPAESLFTPSWKIFCPARHPPTFIQLSNLAASFDAQGRLGKAISCLEQVIGGRLDIGEDAGCDFLEMSIFQSDEKFQIWRFSSEKKTTALSFKNCGGGNRSDSYISLWLHSEIRIAQEINHNLNYSYYFSSCVISSPLSCRLFSLPQ